VRFAIEYIELRGDQVDVDCGGTFLG